MQSHLREVQRHFLDQEWFMCWLWKKTLIFFILILGWLSLPRWFPRFSDPKYLLQIVL
jgi:hypothetical protein